MTWIWATHRSREATLVHDNHINSWGMNEPLKLEDRRRLWPHELHHVTLIVCEPKISGAAGLEGPINLFLDHTHQPDRLLIFGNKPHPITIINQEIDIPCRCAGRVKPNPRHRLKSVKGVGPDYSGRGAIALRRKCPQDSRCRDSDTTRTNRTQHRGLTVHLPG